MKLDKYLKFIRIFIVALIIISTFLPILTSSYACVGEDGTLIQKTNYFSFVYILKNSIFDNNSVVLKIIAILSAIALYSSAFLSILFLSINSKKNAKISIIVLMFCLVPLSVAWFGYIFIYLFAIILLGALILLSFSFQHKKQKLDFGQKLKLLRNNKNITQQELADSLYISRSVIAKYETNQSLPSLRDVELISQYFNVNVGYLFDSNAEITISQKYVKFYTLVHNIICFITLFLNLLFIVFAYLPILNGYSLMNGASLNNSSLVLFTFIYCILSIIFNCFWKFFLKNIKTKTMISVFIDINFVICVILIIFSILIGFGGISSIQ